MLNNYDVNRKFRISHHQFNNDLIEAITNFILKNNGNSARTGTYCLLNTCQNNNCNNITTLRMIYEYCWEYNLKLPNFDYLVETLNHKYCSKSGRRLSVSHLSNYYRRDLNIRHLNHYKKPNYKGYNHHSFNSTPEYFDEYESNYKNLN